MARRIALAFLACAMLAMASANVAGNDFAAYLDSHAAEVSALLDNSGMDYGLAPIGGEGNDAFADNGVYIGTTARRLLGDEPAGLAEAVPVEESATVDAASVDAAAVDAAATDSSVRAAAADSPVDGEVVDGATEAAPEDGTVQVTDADTVGAAATESAASQDAGAADAGAQAQEEILDQGTTEVTDEDPHGSHDAPVDGAEAAEGDAPNPDPYAEAKVVSETTDDQSVASQPNTEDPKSVAAYASATKPTKGQPAPASDKDGKAALESAHVGDAPGFAKEVESLSGGPVIVPEAAVAALPADAKKAAADAAAAAQAKANSTVKAATDAANSAHVKVTATAAAAGSAASKGMKLSWPVIAGIAGGGFALLAVATAGVLLYKTKRSQAGPKEPRRQRSSAGGDVERGSRGGWRLSRGGAK